MPASRSAFSMNGKYRAARLSNMKTCRDPNQHGELPVQHLKNILVLKGMRSPQRASVLGQAKALKAGLGASCAAAHGEVMKRKRIRSKGTHGNIFRIETSAVTELTGCSKTLRYKAPEIPRSETYSPVRRNDEG